MSSSSSSSAPPLADPPCAGCADLRVAISASYEAEIQRLRGELEVRDVAIRKLQELCDDLSWAATVEKSIAAAKLKGLKLAINAHHD